MNYDKSIYLNVYNHIKDLIELRLLEDVVRELVALTMPLTFHIEALKCQSIVMRTNLMRQMKIFGGAGVSGCEADVSLEIFEGYKPLAGHQELWGESLERYNLLLDKVVGETAGEIILYKNKPIDAKYHLVCGGATENSENVHGNIVAYLRRVLCNYCSQSPLYESHRDLNLSEIEGRLGVKFTKSSSDRNTSIEGMFTNISRDEAGRIVKVNIAGREFKGNQLMKLLELDSARFSWQPVTIRFTSRGNGDGIGFCQYGGNKLAEDGKKAHEILNYYYTGVEIVKLTESCIKNPLMGKVIVINPACGGCESPGHIGNKGLMEKDVNLKIALFLEENLQLMGATVYLTRRDDEFVPLNERSGRANQIKPHFFISIHQNHISQSTISGSEIYFYRGDKESEKLASIIMSYLVKETATLNRGVKTADFYLLRDVRSSSLHIEVAYLSNPIEEEKLQREEYLKTVARAIAAGIQSYYSCS